MGPFCVVRRETLTGREIHRPAIHTEDIISQQHLMDVHGSSSDCIPNHTQIHSCFITPHMCAHV